MLVVYYVSVGIRRTILYHITLLEREVFGTDKTIFKNRLKELRKAKGYKTQDSFAETLGIGLVGYQKWEQGRRLPDVETLDKICKALDCSIDYLLGRSDYTHVENEMISDITGLSDITITFLSKCISESKKQFPSANDPLIKDARERYKNDLLTNVNCINAIIEDSVNIGIDHMNIFKTIFEFITSDIKPTFTYLQRKDVKDFYEKPNVIEIQDYIHVSGQGNTVLDLGEMYPTIMKDILFSHLSYIKNRYHNEE